MSWRYIIQMLKGLKALHDRKILHRDLKCANVFLSKDGKTVKIGDMNVSKISAQLVTTQTGKLALVLTEAHIPTLGTPYYASPEV